jgi:hypothetical protein
VSFVLKLVVVWILISIPVGVLVGRALRLGHRPQAASDARPAAPEVSEADRPSVPRAS